MAYERERLRGETSVVSAHMALEWSRKDQDRVLADNCRLDASTETPLH